MVIVRDLQDESVRKVPVKIGLPVKIREKGQIAIELTGKEVMDAYLLERRKTYISNLAETVAGLIEDAGMKDSYAEDWPMRVGEVVVDEFEKTVDNNDYFWDIYQNMVEDAVCSFLRGEGIDPETMKKEGD